MTTDRKHNGNTSEITELLNNFINGSYSRAFLIDGEWGTGKTYFVNDFIEKNKKTHKMIKVSLFGVADIKEVRANFNSKFLSTLGKTLKISAGVAKSFTKNALKIDLSDINIADLFDSEETKSHTSKKNIVVFFDDLERCRIPLDDLLGYVNNLTENNGYKVVVVVNTNELSDENRNSFNKNMEKVFSFKTNFINNIYDISKNILDSEIRPEKVRSKVNFIVDMFQNQNTDNLRIVQIVCDKINMLYSKNDEGLGALGDETTKILLQNLIRFIIEVIEKNKKDENDDSLSEDGTSDMRVAIAEALWVAQYSLEFDFIKKYCANEDYSLKEIRRQIVEVDKRRKFNSDNPLNDLNSGNVFLMQDKAFENLLQRTVEWIQNKKISIMEFPTILRVIHSVEDKILLFGQASYIENLVKIMKERISQAGEEELKEIDCYNFRDENIGMSNDIQGDTKALWEEILKVKSEFQQAGYANLDFSDNEHYDIFNKIPQDSELLAEIGVENIYNKIVNAESNEEVNNIRGCILGYYRDNPGKRKSNLLIELKGKVQLYTEETAKTLEISRIYILKVFVDTLDGNHYGGS